MSHLGEQISALVDGELSGADLDRANAHLAMCEPCRAEAAALRALKRELRALAGRDTDDELTRRLLAMAGPGGPVPSRRLRREQYGRERLGRTPRGGRSWPGRASTPARGRYVLWSAVSLVVVGIGTAAFSMGGGATSEPGPKITPQLEMFSVEHALTFGDVPFPDPTQPATGAAKP